MNVTAALDRHTGSALVQARRLYRAALALGWEIVDLDLYDGVVRIKGCGSNEGCLLFARRTGNGLWCAGRERWESTQTTIGPRWNRSRVERLVMRDVVWMRASDGRRSMPAPVALRSLVEHMQANPMLPAASRRRARAPRSCAPTTTGPTSRTD